MSKCPIRSYPLILAGGLAGGLVGNAALAAAETDAATVQRLSQEFSDASAVGDGAVLARYLDERVVFIDESGNVSSRADIAAGTPTPQPGVHNVLVQSDFKIELHGTVAVTRFTDNSTLAFHGQSVHAKYLSTEVWLNEAAGWKMISSQTLAVPEDPVALRVPAAALDAFAGTYAADPAFVMKIERHGDALSGSINGAPAFPLKVESADVLFTPGQPRLRRIFERDASGRVTGFASRREGHDIRLTRTAGAGAVSG